MSVAIAERFQHSIRQRFKAHAVKQLARITGLSIRRCEDLLSWSNPRTPTPETIAECGKIFGPNWVAFVLLGGDEENARAQLDARLEQLESNIEELKRLRGQAHDARRD